MSTVATENIKKVLFRLFLSRFSITFRQQGWQRCPRPDLSRSFYFNWYSNSEKMSPFEHHFQVTQAELYHFSLRSVFAKAQTYLARHSHQEVTVRDYGENQFEGATWACYSLSVLNTGLKHTGPQLCARHGCAPASQTELAVEQRERKPLPRPGKARLGSSGKGKRI